MRKGKNEQGADTYYVQATRGRGAALAAGYPGDAATLFAYDALLSATSRANSCRDLNSMRRAISCPDGAAASWSSARSRS